MAGDPISKYPLAVAVSPYDPAGPSVPCSHCDRPIRVSRWDRWNGFLVECPYCHHLHGKSLNLKSVILAGLIFNVLSFWFVMRPKKALVATIILGLWIVGGFLLMPKDPPEALAILLILSALMAPMVISATAAVLQVMRVGKPASLFADGDLQEPADETEDAD